MNAKALWEGELLSQLEKLEAGHLLRRLDAKTYNLDFSSNDYLSLNSTGRLLSIAREEIENWSGRIGSTGSRLIRGHHEAFEEAENEFASFSGYPSALLFHTGYAANAGLCDALFSSRDLIFTDRFCHASLLDGIRISGAQRVYFEHNHLSDLEEKLKKHNAGRGRKWIVTEGLFSMDGDFPDLPALVKLAEAHDALIFIDEAHSLGVLGPGGAGLGALYGLQNHIAVAVFPCGKAPGLSGAFVCGAQNLKPFLVNTARSFIFSTAQPPFLAQLLRRAMMILASREMDESRSHLISLSEKLRAGVKAKYETGQSAHQIVPVIIGEEKEALEKAASCRENGMDVRAIRPPSVPKGTSRLRICLHADHTEKDIDRLLDILLR